MSALLERPLSGPVHRCEHRDGCNEPATHQVRLPGWPVLSVCAKHAKQAQVMGFDVEEMK